MPIHASEHFRETLSSNKKQESSNYYGWEYQVSCIASHPKNVRDEHVNSIKKIQPYWLYLFYIKPGIELFWRPATRQLSSPQQHFTSEFGMVSVWFYCAIDTRKGHWVNSIPWRLQSNVKLIIMRSSPRSVSMAQLHTLLYFHLPPINGCSSRDLTYLM